MNSNTVFQDSLDHLLGEVSTGELIQYLEERRHTTTEKQFYVVYCNYGDEVEDDIPPQDLTDEQFKAIAEEQGHVYSAEELCAEWNDETLPVIDSFIRYL